MAKTVEGVVRGIDARGTLDIDVNGEPRLVRTTFMSSNRETHDMLSTLLVGYRIRYEERADGSMIYGRIITNDGEYKLSASSFGRHFL